jgi:hypothetical protein
MAVVELPYNFRWATYISSLYLFQTTFHILRN